MTDQICFVCSNQYNALTSADPLTSMGLPYDNLPSCMTSINVADQSIIHLMFIGMVETGEAFVRSANFSLRRVPSHIEEAVVFVILLLLIPTIIYVNVVLV